MTDEQQEFATTLDAVGRFPSVSAALQRAALAEILGRRSGGRFVSAEAMDARLSRLLERKRQAHAVRD